MRTRREKLSAQQLMTRNFSEAIVDKDNHAADACKYVVMSHPDDQKVLRQAHFERLEKLWKERSPTEAMLELPKIQEEEREPGTLGRTTTAATSVTTSPRKAKVLREARARGF